MKRRLLVLIALLLTFTLACSVFAPKSKEDPAATTLPSAGEDSQPAKQETDKAAGSPTPATDDGKEDADEPISLDPDALAGLNSYRLRMTWDFTDENNVTEQFTIKQEAIREPVAQRFVMSGNVDQNIEFIQVGETQWVRFGDEWMQTPVSADDTMDEFDSFFIQPETMLSDLEEGDYEDLGTETINGMKTRHLRVKAENWAMMGTFNSGDIESGVAEVWIVNERDLPEFAVRFTMEMEGTIEKDKKGKLIVTWEVYDINEPFTIEPPAKAENIGLPPEVPLCPGSSEVTAMGSLVIFVCEGDVKSVGEFYTAQLTSSGWEKTQGTDMEAMSTSAWEKNDETLQLTITPHDSGTGSNVMIVTGE